MCACQCLWGEGLILCIDGKKLREASQNIRWLSLLTPRPLFYSCCRAGLHKRAASPLLSFSLLCCCCVFFICLGFHYSIPLVFGFLPLLHFTLRGTRLKTPRNILNECQPSLCLPRLCVMLLSLHFTSPYFFPVCVCERNRGGNHHAHIHGQLENGSG